MQLKTGGVVATTNIDDVAEQNIGSAIFLFNTYFRPFDSESSNFLE